MIIKFENTLKDLLYFNIMSLFRLPAGLIIVLVLALNIVTKYNEYMSRGLLFFLIHQVIFLTGFLIIIILLSFILILIKLVTSGFKSVLCEHVMEFKDDGFTEKTEYNESKYMWEGVPKSVVTGNYIFIYVSSTIALIIPRRYLSEPETVSLLQLLKIKGIIN